MNIITSLIIFAVSSIFFSISPQFIYGENSIIEKPDTLVKTTQDGDSITEMIKKQPHNYLFKEYMSNPIGVKLIIPLEWEIYQEFNSTEACFEKSEFGQCLIMFLDKPLYKGISFFFMMAKGEKENESLGDHLAKNYLSLKETEGFTLINDKELTIDTYPAWEIEYSAISDNKLHKISTITVDVNGTFYYIAYKPHQEYDYSKYLPQVQKVLDLLEFIPSIPPVPPEVKEPSFLKKFNMKLMPLSEALDNMTSEEINNMLNSLNNE